MNYIEMHKDRIETTQCGILLQVIGENNNASCSVALVSMKENESGLSHYHDNITEIYVFNKGKGTITINREINEIDGHKLFIVPPKTTHFISSITNMEFLCICTPPWTNEHEFETTEILNKIKVEEYKNNGILIKFSDDPEHSVNKMKINNYYLPDEGSKKYNRIYYFISGTGTINIDSNEYEINANTCFEVLKDSKEFIKTDNELEVILIQDIYNKK